MINETIAPKEEQKLPLVAKWLLMTQDNVLDQFNSLTDAFSDGKGQKRFVYVPGTRKDRVLLVAHADTVWLDDQVTLGYHNNILFSKDRFSQHNKNGKFGIGIGADDRAGCAIVWELRKLGHSILITSGEEKGCIASNRIMNNAWWRKELNDTHNFAVQFDRRGSKDIVFYNVGTNEFANYVKNETNYVPASGSFTDIRVLCKDICGVNMSVGYYSEHTTEERLSVDQWMNTLVTVKNWLSKPDLQRYKQNSKDEFKITYSNYSDGYNSHNEHYSGSGCWNSSGHYVGNPSNFKSSGNGKKRKKNYENQEEKEMASLVIDDVSGMEKLECPYCTKTMIEAEWYANLFKCIHCETMI